MEDEFQNNVEKLIIKSKTKDISFQLLNPLYKRLSDNNDTDNSFTVEYTGTTLWDSSWNKTSTLSGHTSDDKIEPKILSRETNDSDNNGQIDSITITTSENLNDNFSSTYAVPNIVYSNKVNMHVKGDSGMIVEKKKIIYNL